ncbi:hypothetical protein CD006_22440 [Enterobacter sp. 10-1]|nr:hypothetical protein CD006_22440 [Enterobacter sp. 10-1]
MKPIQYVLLWFGEALLFTVTFVLLYVLIPEVKMYRLITDLTGFMSDFTWDKYYFLSVCLTSLLIVSIVVYITALIKSVNPQRTRD